MRLPRGRDGVDRRVPDLPERFLVAARFGS